MAIREPSPDQSLAAPSLWLWGHLFAATWYQVPVAKPHAHENIMPSSQCKEFWNLMPRHCFMDSRTFARASGPAPASKHFCIHSLPWMSWSQMVEQRPFVLFKKLPCMKACIHSGWKCRWCASMCAVWYNLRHLATSDASTTCPPILPTRAQLYHPSSPSISPQPLNNHSNCATPRGSAMAMVISMVRRHQENCADCAETTKQVNGLDNLSKMLEPLCYWRQ